MVLKTSFSIPAVNNCSKLYFAWSLFPKTEVMVCPCMVNSILLFAIVFLEKHKTGAFFHHL
jgi:hypothetical protein